MAFERVRRAWFNLIHTHNLVYNTCWEDPRVDRQALNLSSKDEVLVITSAGCNALDYVLAGAGRVHAVDMNPLQNALLELKLAAARTLEYDDYFLLFGRGRAVDWNTIYPAVRTKLPASAQEIWDRRGSAYFNGQKAGRSFYFRGSSGTFAWLVNAFINRVAKLRGSVDQLLDARTVEEQQKIYQEQRLSERLFRPLVKFLLRRDTTMAMLGVPRSQRRQLDQQYSGGIVQFIVDRVEAVLTQKPLADNYFWRVYLTGEYTADCCPEYLKEVNYSAMQSAHERVTVTTDSVLGYLNDFSGRISRYVLLDHMDWLHEHHRDVLSQEWQAVVDHAADDCRVLWRSAGFSSDFINPIRVRSGGSTQELRQLLSYETDLANQLHGSDRVNTYGSFYIADLQSH